jgi:peptide/nickel transport system substrate-binding protein
MQITLKLRPNVKFHNLAPVNGRTLDVDDVLFSWKRFTDTSPSRGAIANAANPDAPVVSLTAPDTRTLVIKLKEPLAYALSLFGGREQVNIMPKEAGNPAVLDLRGQHLGAGPYYLSKFEPSVSFTFKKHPDYWDKDNVYADEIDYPLIPEYAAALAQFRAGRTFVMGGFGIIAAGGASVRQEDVVALKRDVPAINLFAGDVNAAATRMLFGRRTPAFRDERVRLAFQLSFDRETWIDTLLNGANFEKEGLAVEKSWLGAFPNVGRSFEGWRLEPRDPKSFGPNAKYYQHDVAEAKRLLAAAGHANGLEVTATYAAPGGNDVAARHGMAEEAGFRFKNNPVDNATEFIPKYRDVQADFDGLAYKGTIVISADPVDRMSQLYWSKSGTAFMGFDSAGKGDASGDPFVDQTLVKARRELDVNKAKALINEVERYLAPKAYGIHAGLAGATTFHMAWPALGNFWVWQGSYHSNVFIPNTRWWVDDSKPPLRAA